MASSEVEIANLALSHAGAGGPIASLAEASVEARECLLHYASCRDLLLRSHPWNFAQRQAALALLTTTVEGWAYEYQWPADCLQIHHVRAGGYDSSAIIWANETMPASLGTTVLYPPLPFDIGVTTDGTGRTILTDAYQAYASYTAGVSIVTLFDPLFSDALAYLLASRIVQRLTGNRSAKSDCTQMYQATLQAAMVRDANEARPTTIPEPDWILARS
jgi:hypothetical protein